MQQIAHIDFGDCFEAAQQREKYPERVPFRLTRMLVKAMEVSRKRRLFEATSDGQRGFTPQAGGVDGTFSAVGKDTMRVLRTNKESLLAVLEAFIYDPLLSWRIVEVGRGLGPYPSARLSGLYFLQEKDVGHLQPTETLEDSIARDTVEQGKLSGSTSLSRAGSDPRKDKEKRKTLRKNISSNNSRVRLITSSSEGWDGMTTESSFERQRDEGVLTCEDFTDREHNEKHWP